MAAQDQDFEEEKIENSKEGQGHDSESVLEADDENDSVATTCNSPITPSPVIMDIAPKRSLRMAKPKQIATNIPVKKKIIVAKVDSGLKRKSKVSKKLLSTSKM